MVIQLPQLLKLHDLYGNLAIDSYRDIFIHELVSPSPHTIWDGSSISFSINDFDHAFSRTNALDNTRRWDECRLYRMQWVLPMLCDSYIDRFVDERTIDKYGVASTYRIIEHNTPFCVVIKRNPNRLKSYFVTAMCVDRTAPRTGKSAYQKIIGSCKWD